MKKSKLFLKLQLLFTSKLYRRVTILLLKNKILSLPGIRNIISLYETHEMYKGIHELSNFDQYTAIKTLESNSNIDKISSQNFCFKLSLILLKTVITSNDTSEKEFEQAKNDVLSYEDIINNPNLQEFKEWVENIDKNETDYSKVQAVINSF